MNHNNQATIPKNQQISNIFPHKHYESPKSNINFPYKQLQFNDNRYRIHEDSKVNARHRYQSVNQKSKMDYLRKEPVHRNSLEKSKEGFKKPVTSFLLNKYSETIFEQEKLENGADSETPHQKRISSQSLGIYRQKYGAKSWLVDEINRIEEEAPKPNTFLSDIPNTNQISTKQTIHQILQQYKQIYWQPILPLKFQQTVDFPVRVKQSLIENRNIILGILIYYHRTMKLPIEALFIAVDIFDRYLEKKSRTSMSSEQLSSLIDLNSALVEWNDGIFHLREMAIIGITALYVSHKIEKFKVYHINSWMKHLTLKNVPLLSLALPELCEQTQQIRYQKVQQAKSQLLKKILQLEAEIFNTLDFNLWRTTPYEILMSLYAILVNNIYLSSSSENKQQIIGSHSPRQRLNKPYSPRQRSNKLHSPRQTSIKPHSPRSRPKGLVSEQQFYFCQYALQLTIFCDFSMKSDAIQSMHNRMRVLDIVLGIIYLGMFFFKEDHGGEPKQRMIQVMKIIDGEQLEDEWREIFEHKLGEIKKLSNKIFKMLMNEKPVYISGIMEKYSKFHNHCISQVSFARKQDSPTRQPYLQNMLEPHTKSSGIISPVLHSHSFYNMSELSNSISLDTDRFLMNSGS